MTDPTALADELERLAKAATKAPWIEDVDDDDPDFVLLHSEEHGALARFVKRIEGEDDPKCGAAIALTLFTRNHALAIVALLRAGEKMRDSAERVYRLTERRTVEHDQLRDDLAAYDAAKESRDG